MLGFYSLLGAVGHGLGPYLVQQVFSRYEYNTLCALSAVVNTCY